MAVHHSSAAVRLCVFLRLAAVPDVHQMPWKAGCQPLSGPRQIRRPWMFHGGEKRGRRKLEAHADQLMEVKWASASSSPPSIGLCGWNWWSWYWHHLHAAFPSSANQGGTRQARHLPQVETSRFRRRPAELAFDRPHAPRSSKGHVLRCPVE